jgi:hypothetical protein
MGALGAVAEFERDLRIERTQAGHRLCRRTCAASFPIAAARQRAAPTYGRAPCLGCVDAPAVARGLGLHSNWH